MSNDNSDRDQTTTEPEESREREERERRRMGSDEREESETTDPENSTPPPSQPIIPDTDDEAEKEKDGQEPRVPQIRIDKSPHLETNSQIAKEPTNTDRANEVPQIHLSSGESIDSKELEESVNIDGRSLEISTPQVTIHEQRQLKPVELDDDKPEGLERIQQVQIPQVTVKQVNRIRPFDIFLDTVPSHTLQKNDGSTIGVTDEREQKQEKDREGEPQDVALSPVDELETSDDWVTGDWPDPLELLFGPGGSEITSDNPVVVLVEEDDLIGVVETVVKRLYREKEWGEPDLQKFATANQLADEERWLSADSQIFTAELSDDEWEQLKDEYYDEWTNIWRNGLDQLFSGQQFGAIIFNRTQLPVPEDMSSPHHHPPNVVTVDPKVPWKEVATLFWESGFENARRARTFSQLFDRDANGVAQDRWVQIMLAADGKFDLATNNDETASDEHYALKVFVVKWLAEQLREVEQEFTAYDDIEEIEDYRDIENRILTEQPLQESSSNSVKPDVKYGSRVFEVEMFFGEADGSGIKSKLQQTVRKYENFEQQIDEISIVVDNLTSLLHLKELARFKRTHQPWEEEYVDIGLYTVYLKQEELVRLNEIVERMKSRQR